MPGVSEETGEDSEPEPRACVPQPADARRCTRRTRANRTTANPCLSLPLTSCLLFFSYAGKALGYGAVRSAFERLFLQLLGCARLGQYVDNKQRPLELRCPEIIEWREDRQSRGRQFSWRVRGQPHNQFDIENAQTIFSINHDCSFSTRAASAAVPATRSRRPRTRLPTLWDVSDGRGKLDPPDFASCLRASRARYLANGPAGIGQEAGLPPPSSYIIRCVRFRTRRFMSRRETLCLAEQRRKTEAIKEALGYVVHVGGAGVPPETAAVGG